MMWLFAKNWHGALVQEKTLGLKDYKNMSWRSLFGEQQQIAVPVTGKKNYALVARTNFAALKTEGEKLDHCVGGYAGDCLVYDTHILSVVDPEGNPVSTMELEHNPKIVGSLNLIQHYGYGNSKPSAESLEVEKWLKDNVDEVTDFRNGYYDKKKDDDQKQKPTIKIDYEALSKAKRQRLDSAVTLFDRVCLWIGFDPLDKAKVKKVKEEFLEMLPNTKKAIKALGDYRKIIFGKTAADFYTKNCCDNNLSLEKIQNGLADLFQRLQEDGKAGTYNAQSLEFLAVLENSMKNLGEQIQNLRKDNKISEAKELESLARLHDLAINVCDKNFPLPDRITEEARLRENFLKMKNLEQVDLRPQAFAGFEDKKENKAEKKDDAKKQKPKISDEDIAKNIQASLDAVYGKDVVIATVENQKVKLSKDVFGDLDKRFLQVEVKAEAHATPAKKIGFADLKAKPFMERLQKIPKPMPPTQAEPASANKLAGATNSVEKS